MSMMLSKNFSLKGMTKSDTAARLGISNEPTTEEIASLIRLCTMCLQPARDYFNSPIYVNSGYRSSELCLAIGSTARSSHSFGWSADVESYEVSNIELFNWFIDNVPFTTIIAEYFDKDDARAGWVHISYNGTDSKIVKLKDKEHNYKVVTPSYINSIYT